MGFVKFGAASSGPGAEQRFARLLDACEGYAASRDARRIVTGVSTGRRAAYRQLLDRGDEAGLIGVTMHQPDDGAYHHASAYVIDDWRSPIAGTGPVTGPPSRPPPPLLGEVGRRAGG